MIICPNLSFKIFRKFEISSKQCENSRCGTPDEGAIFTLCNRIESVVSESNNWQHQLFSKKMIAGNQLLFKNPVPNLGTWWCRAPNRCFLGAEVGKTQIQSTEVNQTV